MHTWQWLDMHTHSLTHIPNSLHFHDKWIWATQSVLRDKLNAIWKVRGNCPKMGQRQQRNLTISQNPDFLHKSNQIQNQHLMSRFGKEANCVRSCQCSTRSYRTSVHTHQMPSINMAWNAVNMSNLAHVLYLLPQSVHLSTLFGISCREFTCSGFYSLAVFFLLHRRPLCSSWRSGRHSNSGVWRTVAGIFAIIQLCRVAT